MKATNLISRLGKYFTIGMIFIFSLNGCVKKEVKPTCQPLVKVSGTVTEKNTGSPFESSRVTLVYDDGSFAASVPVLTATTSNVGFYSLEFSPKNCDYLYSLRFDGSENGHTAGRTVNIDVREQVIDAAIDRR